MFCQKYFLPKYMLVNHKFNSSISNVLSIINFNNLTTKECSTKLRIEIRNQY